MSLDSLSSSLQGLVCWNTSPNPVRLALAVLLLAGAALGPRLLAGNQRWVRAVIALAGLAVLAMASLKFGKVCREVTVEPPEPDLPTLQILQKAIGAAPPTAPASALAAVAVPAPKPRCTPGSFDGRGFAPPNFYAGPDFLTYDTMLRELHPYACRTTPVLDFGIRNSLGTVDTMRVIDGPANAAWGLVQADIKLFMTWLSLDDLRLLGLTPDADMQQRLLKTVNQMVLQRVMHLETVHVISNKPDVRRFADLAGRTVLLPSDSQGSVMSAINLMRLHKLPTDKLRADAGGLEQLAKVIDRQADAVVITAGAPAKLIAAIAAVPIERRRDLHLVEVDASMLGDTYRLDRVHYEKWQSAAVQAPTVRALWVGWDFSAKPLPLFKVRCEQTKQLDTAFKASLPALQADPNAHPAWKTIKLDGQVKGWPTSRC